MAVMENRKGKGNKKRLTKEEREERVLKDKETMQKALGELLTSEGWERWVRVRRHFRRYSFGNQCLIAWQYPEATMVAGFNKWITLNRIVSKDAPLTQLGMKAIKIWCPMRVPDWNKEPDENGERPLRTLFKLGNVFDVSQVVQIEDKPVIDLDPPGQPITGDSHAHLIDRLIEHAQSLGYTVEVKKLRHKTGGYCDATNKVIAVREGLAPNATVRVLVHEIAHAYGVDYKSYTRPQAECLVETVTYLVCTSLGLDTSGESITYVATWGMDDQLKKVESFATTINDIAFAIEEAITA